MTPWKRTPKTFSAGKSPSCEKTIASTIPSKDDNHDNDDDDDDDDDDEDDDDDDKEEGEGEGEGEEEEEDLRGVPWGFFDSSIHRTEHGWIFAVLPLLWFHVLFGRGPLSWEDNLPKSAEANHNEDSEET